MIAATDLLRIWEAGLAAAGIQRTVLLHAAARPAADDLFDVPVGERDADLFALRRELFGAVMPVRLRCPNCAEELEFDFDTHAVTSTAEVSREPITISEGEWTVVFRLPTSADLIATAASVTASSATAEDARDALLRRCVLEAKQADEQVDVDDLPAEITSLVDTVAAAADPCADIRLDVRCPECGGSARADLDIAACLWAELDAWAHAVLVDVHLLASSYGWTESAILELSPLRRRYYLELAGHV